MRDADKGFSCISSGGHFVQQSKTILALGRGSFKVHFYEIILKSCALENVHKVFVRFGLVTCFFVPT